MQDPNEPPITTGVTVKLLDAAIDDADDDLPRYDDHDHDDHHHDDTQPPPILPPAGIPVPFAAVSRSEVPVATATGGPSTTVPPVPPARRARSARVAGEIERSAPVVGDELAFTAQKSDLLATVAATLVPSGSWSSTSLVEGGRRVRTDGNVPPPRTEAPAGVAGAVSARR